MRSLPSSAEKRIRDSKADLIVALYRRCGTFWDAISSIRERWSIEARPSVPPPISVDELYLPPGHPTPARPGDEDYEEWQTFASGWTRELRDLYVQVVPEGCREGAVPDPTWGRFLSACILYDPPAPGLCEFRKVLDARSLTGLPTAPRANDYGMAVPPIAWVRDADKAVDAQRKFDQRIIDELLERFVVPLGLDPVEVMQEILSDPALWEARREKDAENSLRPVIDPKPYHIDDDVRGAFELLKATRTPAARPRRGRPPRDRLMVAECAILRDEHGYKLSPNGHDLEIVEEEAAIVREIIANIAAGATLYSESKRLNDEGIPSLGYRYRDGERRRNAGSWTASTVGRMVHQTAYSGVHRVRVRGRDGREEIIERPVPSIVEPGVRERAEAQLAKNKSRAGELRKNGRKYLLTGLVQCGICGQACTGRTTVSGGKKYNYYGCISNRRERRSSKASDEGKPPHRVTNVRADWLEDLVWTDVRAFIEDPGEVLERLRSEEIDNDASSNELQIRRDALTRRLAAKNTEKDRYVRAYAQGHISEEELAEYVADIKNQTNNLRLLISSVEDDLASLTETREVAESAAEWLLTLRERISEVEDNTPEAFQKRRELVRLLVEKITTDRDEDGHPRVEITYRFGSPPEESFVPSVLNSGPREAE